MSESPHRPKLMRGALVAYESNFIGPIPNIVPFQFNPAELNRTLTSRSPQTSAEEDRTTARSETYQVMGPPVEEISLTAELDATDGGEGTRPFQQTFGLHPRIAALELLLYPPSTQFELPLLGSPGSVAQSNPTVPLVLFVWGIHRAVPVRLTNFSVTEQAFDNSLNPLRATVELGMKVMTTVELQENSFGWLAYQAYQAQKSVLARLALGDEALLLLPF